jgi:tripartite-type tricarboxylate transporter receptor subunit TctC
LFIFPLLKRAHDDIVLAGGHALRKVLILAAVFIAGIVGAAAQTDPARVVTIIVRYPAGGPTEVIARMLASACRFRYVLRDAR